MMKSLSHWILTSLVLLSILLPACGRIQRGQNPAEGDDMTVEMSVTPEPAIVGAATLVFRLVDQQGRPIEGASLDVEGNMSHAGMTPVFGQAASGQQGRYVVPFEWTMGGDWLVTVKVSVAGTPAATRHFPVVVE